MDRTKILEMLAKGYCLVNFTKVTDQHKRSMICTTQGLQDPDAGFGTIIVNEHLQDGGTQIRSFYPDMVEYVGDAAEAAA